MALIYLMGGLIIPFVHVIDEAGASVPITHVESVDFKECLGHAVDGCAICRALSSYDPLSSEGRLQIEDELHLPGQILVDRAAPRPTPPDELTRPRAPPI